MEAKKMLVKEIMTKNPECLPPQTVLKEAAENMLENDFGFLPVGENGNIVGVITDRDIAIRAVAKGLEPDSTSLNEVMTKKVVACHESDDIEKAAETMKKSQIRRLIVLDKREKLAGIISLGDIVTHSEKLNLHQELIRAVSEKSH
jgi:CBS domain-containing protein